MWYATLHKNALLHQNVYLLPFSFFYLWLVWRKATVSCIWTWWVAKSSSWSHKPKHLFCLFSSRWILLSSLRKPNGPPRLIRLAIDVMWKHHGRTCGNTSCGNNAYACTWTVDNKLILKMCRRNHLARFMPSYDTHPTVMPCRTHTRTSLWLASGTKHPSLMFLCLRLQRWYCDLAVSASHLVYAEQIQWTSERSFCLAFMLRCQVYWQKIHWPNNSKAILHVKMSSVNYLNLEAKVGDAGSAPKHHNLQEQTGKQLKAISRK